MNALTSPLRLVPPSEPRIMPTSIDAEMGVLGAILMNNDAYDRVRGILKAEHFAEDIHRIVYDTIEKLVADGKVASPITVGQFMPTIDGKTAMPYLARLATYEIPYTPAQLMSLAHMVFDLAQRREMIGIAEHLRDTAFEAPVGLNSAAVAYSVVSALQELAARACPSSTRVDIKNAAGEMLENAAALMRGDAKERTMPTGFPDLDQHLGGGYRRGTLVVLGARPGAGKTAFVVTSSRRAAAKGTGCLTFSLEVSKEEILASHLTDLAYRESKPVTYQAVLRGRFLSNDDYWCLEDARRRLSELPLVIDAASSLSIAEIGGRVRAEKQRMARAGQELLVVFIDHLRFIRSEGRYQGNANKETGEKTRALKQLAKDEDLCVVLLCQLNRGLEGRGENDRRPVLADLRDSGEIEEDADVVLFLYRQHYYLIKKPEYRNMDLGAIAEADAVEHEADLIIGKNRAGPEKSLKLWCDVRASTMATKDDHGAQETIRYTGGD